MGGERRNRRVLQDIGNLVAKQGHGNGINVSKPVTRFFLFSFLLKCFIFLSSHNFSSVFFCLILLFSFLLGTFVLNYWPMHKPQQRWNSFSSMMIYGSCFEKVLTYCHTLILSGDHPLLGCDPRSTTLRYLAPIVRQFVKF